MLATLTTLVFVCSPTPVLAPPSMTMSSIAPEEDPSTEVVVERGYGWQILAVDAAGIALLVASDSSSGDGLATVGLLTMGFGPGMVHAAHGRPGAMVASMLMRPAAVYGGAILGAASEDCSDGGDFCGLGGAIVGGLIGYGTAVVIDAAFLARERRTERPRSWAPTLEASPNGMRVGIGGSF